MLEQTPTVSSVDFSDGGLGQWVTSRKVRYPPVEKTTRMYAAMRQAYLAKGDLDFKLRRQYASALAISLAVRSSGRFGKA